MLITKEVEIELNPSNIKYFEDLGIKIPRMIDSKGRYKVKKGTKIIVNVENLSDGSNALVDIECDGCGENLKNIKWVNYKKYAQNDGKYYCNKCATNGYKKWVSFYDWCYENLSKEEADEIMKRWDYELNIDKEGNILSPKDITYGSSGLNGKGYWFKCLKHPEHKSEQKNIHSFTNGSQGSITCIQCKSISITNPELIKFLVNKNDIYKYSNGSNKRVLMKCPDCGYEKPMSIPNLIKQGFGCPKCSDGISYPNKFMFNVLEQLVNLGKIKYFETEKRFDWFVYKFKGKIRKGKLDFYFEINGKKYAVEMDGWFHCKDNHMNGQTKEESKFIDNEKDRLCIEHNIYIIRIDSEKSELEWLKNKIIEFNLTKILNFQKENIDWLKCHEFACNSLVKEVCNLWNNNHEISLIIDVLKLAKGTIRKYLKQGTELNWCNPPYDPNIEIKKNFNYIHKKNSVKIKCLTTEEVFDSISDASKKYGINSSSISMCCSKNYKFAGIHPSTNMKMIWEYC